MLQRMIGLSYRPQHAETGRRAWAAVGQFRPNAPQHPDVQISRFRFFMGEPHVSAENVTSHTRPRYGARSRAGPGARLNHIVFAR
jgi:hypothetical protein